MELEKQKIEFEDEEIQALVQRLNKLFTSQQSDFANVCYTIYKIDCWFEDNPDCVVKAKYSGDYYNKNKLFKSLGIKKAFKNKCCQSYQKFMTLTGDRLDVEPKIKEPFVSYTSSKLFELLPLENETILKFIEEKKVSPEMTVKEIREFVKSLKEKEQDADEEPEEEIIEIDERMCFVLANVKMRKDFLGNFKTWGVWFEEPRLKLKYYRCQIGEKILVAVLGKVGFNFYSVEKTYQEDHKFFYLTPDGTLDLDPTCETAILQDMSAIKDKKVYLFER